MNTKKVIFFLGIIAVIAILFGSLFSVMLNESDKKSLEEALKIAVDYVWETINDTYKTNKEDAYGVNFETKIPYLIDRIKKN